MQSEFPWINEFTIGIITSLATALAIFIWRFYRDYAHNRYLRNMQADRMDQLVRFALENIIQSKAGFNNLFAGKSIDDGKDWYLKPDYVSLRLNERFTELNQWKTDAHIVFPKEQTMLVFDIFWKVRQIFRIALKSRQLFAEAYLRQQDLDKLDLSHRVDEAKVETIRILLKEYVELRNKRPYRAYRRPRGKERLERSIHGLFD